MNADGIDKESIAKFKEITEAYEALCKLHNDK